MRQTNLLKIAKAVALLGTSLFVFGGSCFAQSNNLPIYGTDAYRNAEPPKTEEGVREITIKIGRDLYARGDFDEIDKLADTFLKEKSRTPSGLWKLGLFSFGVESESQPRVPSEESWQLKEKKLKDWTEKRPRSPTAHIAYANALVRHAWFIRGGSYASAVRPEAWPKFRQYLEQAADVLQASKSFASHDPRWYEAMATIATYQQWDQRKFANLLKEAFTKEPGFYPTYFAAVLYYTPKWGGSQALIDKFVKYSVERTEKIEGNAMYARIYWYVSQIECDCDLFADTKAYWPKLKQSFETVIRKYPDDWNLNHFAKFACEANDFPKASMLFARIGERISQDAWGRTGVLQRCLYEIEMLKINPKVIG